MRALRLGALWFGIQTVWGAILAIVLQERATALAPHPVATFGAIAATGAAVASVVQLAAGFLSDRRRARTGDRRAFYAAGVALALPALLVLPAASSVPMLWAATLLLQIGMNVATAPYQAIVSDYVEPEAFGRASSWMSIAQFSGSVAGPLLATLLHGPALGIALAIALGGAWLVTDRDVATRRPLAHVARPLRVDANVRTVIVSRAWINVGFYTLVDFVFFFVRESLAAADPQRTAGILLLAITLAGVAGAAIAGRAADRTDKRVVVSASCVAIVVALAALGAASTLPVALVCGVGAGIAWGAFFTADWAIAYAVLPRGAMGTAMGIWNLAATIPQLIAPALTTPLVTALDARSLGLGPRAAFLLVIAEFAIGTLWLWRLRLPRVAAAP